MDGLTERTYRKAEVRITRPDVGVELLLPVRFTAVGDTVRAFNPDDGMEVGVLIPDVEIVYGDGIAVYRESATSTEWYVERIGCGCGGQ